MKTEELQLTQVIPASPNQVYSAWLDERQHTAFIGARATVEPWVGGRYTAWEGYATALIVGLDTGRNILLTWRTADYPPDAPDSHLEFKLEPIAGGTKVTILHKGIPEGQSAQYKEAWKKHYLDSMKKLFGKPEALRNAIREAAKAGRLPIPGVTAAKPGTVRPFTVRGPEALAPKTKVRAASSSDDDDDDSEDREDRFRRYRDSDDVDDRAPRRISQDEMPRKRNKPVPPPLSSFPPPALKGAALKASLAAAKKAPPPPAKAAKEVMKAGTAKKVPVPPKAKTAPVKAAPKKKVAKKAPAKPSKKTAKKAAKKSPAKKAKKPPPRKSKPARKPAKKPARKK